MERRHVIGGALAAGLTGIAGSAPEAAAQDDTGVLVEAINNLHRLLDREFTAAEPGPLDGVAAVRQQQRAFLRANQKYPDFIEVGVDVWESVYYWHIRHRQPLTAQRLTDGRYTQTFMFTNLLLRMDTTPDYVGLGFDGAAQR